MTEQRSEEIRKEALRWEQQSHRRWNRSDGACVIYNDKTPWPNPLNPNARFWLAYAPGEEFPLHKNEPRTRFHIQRRWKTPLAAMKALDREHPAQPATTATTAAETREA